MGDRVLIIIKSEKYKEFSPIAYGHWYGSRALGTIADLKQLMAGRNGDVAYGFARLIGLMHVNVVGNISLGCWSLKDQEIEEIKNNEKEFCEEISHGDAGVIVINSDDYSFKCYEGYLADQEESA